MVRKFPPFRSEREKRTTSGGSLQFPNGFSGKLLFHLTYNRNFRILWLNGKHPTSLFISLVITILYYLNTTINETDHTITVQLKILIALLKGLIFLKVVLVKERHLFSRIVSGRVGKRTIPSPYFYANNSLHLAQKYARVFVCRPFPF